MQRRIHREMFDRCCWAGGDNLLIFYDTFDDGTLAKIWNATSGKGDAAIIVLNGKLLYDKLYAIEVEAAVKECLSPSIGCEIRDATMTLADAVVLYIVTAVTFGHLNPAKFPAVHIADWKTYAGRRMWYEAYAFIDWQRHKEGSNCQCLAS